MSKKPTKDATGKKKKTKKTKENKQVEDPGKSSNSAKTTTTNQGKSAAVKSDKDKSTSGDPKMTTTTKSKQSKPKPPPVSNAKGGGAQQTKPSKATDATKVKNAQQDITRQDDVDISTSIGQFQVTKSETDSSKTDSRVDRRDSYTGTETGGANHPQNAPVYKLDSVFFVNPILIPEINSLGKSKQDSTGLVKNANAPATVKQQVPIDQNVKAAVISTSTSSATSQISSSFCQTLESQVKATGISPPSTRSNTSQMSTNFSESFGGANCSTNSSTDSKTNLSVLSCPELFSTPSVMEKQQKPFSPGVLQKFDSETSIQSITYEKNIKFSDPFKPPKCNPPSATYKSNGATANYLSSLTLLNNDKCGTGGTTAHSLNTVKRHLISSRNAQDGSILPIGVLYGSIEGYLYGGANVFHQMGLIKPNCMDSSLDICLVDESDNDKLSKIYQLESKSKYNYILCKVIDIFFVR